ncbi:fimbrial protein [Pseudomonas kairouanensis]|uniref:Fimbrial protein n=1 Tax=Pseudomonas kairouanensis TaxID=2293832 RepID=A0A4Z0AV75_9PSED|nr:fimbrial protein [Pseudomonas kairouanensis]TFY89818.1 fimbrial protein [Pseudomonas kairouanensis]
MKRSIKLISTLLVLSLPIAAQAACDRYPNAVNNVSFPATISVADSLPVGALITSRPFGGNFPIVIMNCSGTTWNTSIGRYTSHISLPGINGVYITNVPGIGMRVSGHFQGGAKHVFSLQSSNTPLAPGAHIHNVVDMQAEFYKIGPVQSGTIPAGNLWDNKYSGNNVQRILLNNSVNFVNPATTCDLAAGDVNRTITLPDVQVSAFNSDVYSGVRDFDLTANCAKASNVTFRISGTPAPGNALLFANTGSAGGVALWMYSRINGVPATISNGGTRTLVVSGNRAVLPLSAAYHKNGTVSQGTLVSTATVNITYN